MIFAVIQLLVVILSSVMISKALAFSAGLAQHFSVRVRINPTRSRMLSHVRPPANELSLDTNLLSNQPDLVISHLQSRKVDPLTLDKVFAVKDLQTERKSLIFNGDAAKNVRKVLSKEIGILLKQDKHDEVAELKEKVEAAHQISSAADERLASIEQSINDIWVSLPNLLDDSVPEGLDETNNIVEFTWGAENRKIGEKYLWHDDLARKVHGIDLEAANRMSGARFSVLVGPVARLERALTQFMLDQHTDRGYTEVSVPFIVSRSTLEGTGQLPKFEDDLFQVNHTAGGEEAFLIPTAEVPLTNLFREQILYESDLPLRLVCASPSFRAEAGSNGRDVRGLLRQHQFNKVEMVRICIPETSSAEHFSMVQDAEHILQALQLPYRRVLLCSGDTGFSARKCYDLEVWLPGQQMYREISSISNCFDFQARRMSLRYRIAHHSGGAEGGDSAKGGKKNAQKKTTFPHTLNGSGLAVGRTLLAILENNQHPDGSITIPEVLRPYMNNLQSINVPTLAEGGKLYTSMYSSLWKQ